MDTASIGGGVHSRFSVAGHNFPPKPGAEQKLRWRRCKLRNRQRCCLPTSTTWTTLSYFTLQLKLRKIRRPHTEIAQL